MTVWGMVDGGYYVGNDGYQRLCEKWWKMVTVWKIIDSGECEEKGGKW